MSFIDKYSWKSFLGTQAKNITINKTYAYWNTSKATNVVLFKGFRSFKKIESLTPFTTYYLNEHMIKKLSYRFVVEKHRTKSTIIDISKLKITGKKNKDIKWAINNINKKNIVIEDNYRKIEDVEFMIKNWKIDGAERYFQDRSSKNIYFYKNNYHEGCINIFCYDADKLISFGTLSPSEKGYSSYILGKALFNEYKGLSEYTDVMLFKKGLEFGIKEVDMGDGGKNLKNYKNKFSSAREEIFYHGKIFER